MFNYVAVILCLHFAIFVNTVHSKTALVLGGNGFIGSSTCLALIDRGFTVTTLNRGTNYWDWMDRVAPFVKTIHCDREQLLDQCQEIRKLDGKYFDVIIDFSGFLRFQVHDVVRHFNGRFGTYIFMSTDSVYEVSRESETGSRHYTLETDAVRPDNLEEQKKLNAADPYANGKLECEEVLEELLLENWLQKKFSYVSLRAPDVIGARDSTLRFWMMMTQVRLALEYDKPLKIPTVAKTSFMSFAYVNDVANVVAQIAEISVTKKKELKTSYNFAYRFGKSLGELAETIADSLGYKENSLRFEYVVDASAMYPSVKRGPISVQRITEELRPKTTSWSTAVENAVKFFLEVEKSPYTRNATENMAEKLAMYTYMPPKKDVLSMINLRTSEKEEL